MFCFGQTGHEHNRNVRRLRHGLELARHFKTVHTGHHGIQQHNVRQGLGSTLQGRHTTERHQHGVARFIQRVMQHGQVIRHVVHDQHHITVGAVKGVVCKELGHVVLGGCHEP